MIRHRTIPTAITTAPLRTVRPVMLRGLYVNPEKEVVRMKDAGWLVRIATGTYTAKPDTVPAGTPWRPGFEEAAMAYATAQYGPRVPVLCGLGAARFHHAIPRAIGVTTVAVPEQHRPTTLTDGGRVVFTITNVDRLDARYEKTALGGFLVTTPEQTLIDLLDRPDLGGMHAQAMEAAAALRGVTDRERIAELAASRTPALQKKVRDFLA